MITKEAIEAGVDAANKRYLDFMIDDENAFDEAVKAGITAALAAMPVQAEVEVKALEWVEHWGGSNDDLPSWRGKNPIGLHVSVDFIGKYNLDRHSDAPQDELKAAKAAAQADYEARIMAALEPAPSLAAENERLRAALDKLVKSANEVNRLGASTGPQWMKMTVAIVSAKAALERK